MKMTGKLLNLLLIKSLLLYFVIASSLANAQVKANAFEGDSSKLNGTKGGKQEINSAHLIVYQRARSLGDNNTAIQSLYYLIATEPKASSYVDTLALVYLESGAYVQAFQLSDTLLLSNSKDNLALEIKAISAFQLQQPIIALDSYGTLYERTSKISYGFRKLQMECGLRRMIESVRTSEQLLAKIPEKDSTLIDVEKLDGKSYQKVTLRANIFYMQGLALQSMEEKDRAVVAFQTALKISPGYDLAKKKLDEVLAMTKTSKIKG